MSWISQNVSPDVANYLFNIKVRALPTAVGTIQRDARPDLNIDFDLLEEQLEQTPEMLAFWDLLLSEQKFKLAVLERRALTIRSLASRRVIDEYLTRELTLRRQDLEDLVESDDEVIKIEAEIIQARKAETQLKCVVMAIQMKSEHLRSLAGFKKLERSETRS